jgi:hypothetical protein
MSEQTVQSRDINIASVFQDFYVVPDYQREYVWDSDDVEILLVDINSELAGSDPNLAPEYFIGSIVVCPGASGMLELIDGQQRMTTLFLTLCAIRDSLESLDQQIPGALPPQISSVSTDSSGNDHFRYRLDLQYEDSIGVLERIAKAEPEEKGRPTRSITNIRNAYAVALSFIARELGGDPTRIRAFYGYLTNKVKLIRIQTEDVTKALKIFETINDRGVGLDAMDLLKNLLFMKAGRAEFDQLKAPWKQLQDTIHSMGEKPLRFLRYFIFSRYDVDVLREDDIYDWLLKHEPAVGYARQPVAFANELLEGARDYRNFLGGKDHDGEKSRFLENLQLLGGKAARQHLILLLAGRHLPGPLFDRLAREVEELFFVYVIAREPTRDFERDFARWATELRAVSDDLSLTSLIDKRLAPAKAILSARFDDAFHRLRTQSVQGYRLRYILGKLVQDVELDAYGETEGTKWLSRFTGKGFQIEHIFPQGASEAALAEFGAHDDPDIAQRLGNLTLVENSINASLGNKPYSQKRPIYPQSQLLFTRAIAERPKVGLNTKIDRAVADLESFASWDEIAVERRQTGMALLARRVWNISSDVAAVNAGSPRAKKRR